MSAFWISLELRVRRQCGKNWSYKRCKAPVKMSPPTNQHPVFYKMDGLLPKRASKKCQRKLKNKTRSSLVIFLRSASSWIRHIFLDVRAHMWKEIIDKLIWCQTGLQAVLVGNSREYFIAIHCTTHYANVYETQITRKTNNKTIRHTLSFSCPGNTDPSWSQLRVSMSPHLSQSAHIIVNRTSINRAEAATADADAVVRLRSIPRFSTISVVINSFFIHKKSFRNSSIIISTNNYNNWMTMTLILQKLSRTIWAGNRMSPFCIL